MSEENQSIHVIILRFVLKNRFFIAYKTSNVYGILERYFFLLFWWLLTTKSFKGLISESEFFSVWETQKNHLHKKWDSFYLSMLLNFFLLCLFFVFNSFALTWAYVIVFIRKSGRLCLGFNFENTMYMGVTLPSQMPIAKSTNWDVYGVPKQNLMERQTKPFININSFYSVHMSEIVIYKNFGIEVFFIYYWFMKTHFVICQFFTLSAVCLMQFFVMIVIE